MDVISESGVISADGQLRMPMDRLRAFFASHKGQRVVVRFEAATPGSSNVQQAYFYQYVLPTIQQAYRETGERMTEDLTERALFMQYPGRLKKANGEPADRARELDQSQMSDFLEWLKQFAAENLYVYIEDPRTL